MAPRPSHPSTERVSDEKNEVNFERANRLDLDQLTESNYLITMSYAIPTFNPDQYGVESRE